MTYQQYRFNIMVGSSGIVRADQSHLHLLREENKKPNP